MLKKQKQKLICSVSTMIEMTVCVCGLLSVDFITSRTLQEQQGRNARTLVALENLHCFDTTPLFI